MDRKVDEQMNGEVNEWIVDEWTGTWMDGWIDKIK